MTMFSNVRGWANGQLSERDFDAETATALARDLRNRRWRESVTFDDAVAVLWGCGCVATVKQTEADAKKWIDEAADNPYIDRRRLAGATTVRAASAVRGARRRVWRLSDGEPLPLPALDGCAENEGGRHVRD